MKIAVFPGSFDPLTLAHLDLIERGLEVFDKVFVAVGVNTTKKGMFDHDTRIEMIKASVGHLPVDRVGITRYEGLTVGLCRALGARFILRGMRNGLDFESERAIALNNQQLAPEIETVFLLSQAQHSHISSTIIREILSSGGSSVGHLLPEPAMEIIKERGENSIFNQ
jgi:pantetheine-phosphate adenylyltransferase